MQTRTRVVGSGFTTFNYRGKPIAFLEEVRDTGQRPMGGPGGPGGFEAITVLGDRHPREIATTRVLTEGTLSMVIRELWAGPVWQQLMGLETVHTITDAFERIAAEPTDITCQMVITSPTGITRGKTYHGCVVTFVDDSETITVGALTVPRRIDVTYTHTTPLIPRRAVPPTRSPAATVRR